MNKYIKQFQECMKNPPHEVAIGGGKSRQQKHSQKRKTRSESDLVVGALAIVNAATLCAGTLTDECLLHEEKENIIEFVEWFLSRYAERQDIMFAIQQNWPQGARVFILYEKWAEENLIKVMEKSWEELSEEEQSMVQTLADIIWKQRTYRRLTTIRPDGEESGFEMERVIPKRELDHTRDLLRLVIADFLYSGGVMIYEKENPKKKNAERGYTSSPYTVYGFRAYDLANGKRVLEALSPNRLKEAVKTMPDEVREVWEADDYDIIRLPWQTNEEKPNLRIIK